MTHVVLHVADFAAPYPGAFVRQLTMLDDELRRTRSARSVFAFPLAAQTHSWFAELDAGEGRVLGLEAASARTVAASASALANFAKRWDVSIMHCHFGSYDLAAVLAVGWLRRRGIRCALVWHYRTALECDVDRRSWIRRAKDLARYRIAGRFVDGCVGVTAAVTREAARRGLGSKAVAMLAGCDTDAFTPNADVRDHVRSELGVQSDDVVILHLGWAWERKGGDLLARAARILRDRGETRLAVVSVGAPVDADAAVRSLPFTDRIADLHRGADIFVSASRSEAFGNGVVEAMASATVVVAALAGGQRETFEDAPGCVAVPVGDAGAIADALEALIAQQHLWSALGDANRAYAVETFDMRDWARRMADYYDSLTETV